MTLLRNRGLEAASIVAVSLDRQWRIVTGIRGLGIRFHIEQKVAPARNAPWRLVAVSHSREFIVDWFLLYVGTHGQD